MDYTIKVTGDNVDTLANAVGERMNEVSIQHAREPDLRVRQWLTEELIRLEALDEQLTTIADAMLVEQVNG